MVTDSDGGLGLKRLELLYEGLGCVADHFVCLDSDFVGFWVCLKLHVAVLRHILDQMRYFLDMELSKLLLVRRLVSLQRLYFVVLRAQLAFQLSICFFQNPYSLQQIGLLFGELGFQFLSFFYQFGFRWVYYHDAIILCEKLNAHLILTLLQLIVLYCIGV